MGGGVKLAPAVHVTHAEPWERRDLLGVHPQKQVRTGVVVRVPMCRWLAV